MHALAENSPRKWKKSANSFFFGNVFPTRKIGDRRLKVPPALEAAVETVEVGCCICVNLFTVVLSGSERIRELEAEVLILKQRVKKLEVRQWKIILFSHFKTG